MSENNEQLVERLIFKCRFGSHLYGTNTPESDLDYKAVYMENIDHIILGTDKRSIQKNTNNDRSRNSAEDVDVEYKELRVFLQEAMAGQTYALDMLFCNEENTIFKTKEWDYIQEHRDKLLSSNVNAFMGYCRQQAAKYGLKGTRMAELERVIEALNSWDELTLVNFRIKESEYVTFIEDKNGTKFINVIGKKHPLTRTTKLVTSELQGLLDKFGERTKLAKENNGIDWKAISHAYRCMYEVKELLTTGTIRFPLDKAEELKQIKAGNFDWNNVNQELPLLMEEVQCIANGKNLLAKEPNKEFWDNFVLDLYKNSL